MTAPLGLADVGPGGFSPNDVLALVGERAYDAQVRPSSSAMDSADYLVEHRPFRVAPVSGSASAESVTVTEGGEVTRAFLRISLDVLITSDEPGIDVTGPVLLFAHELVDERIQWSSDGAEGVATGDLPDWAQNTAEAEALSSDCGQATGDPDVWEDGVIGASLEGAVASPHLIVGIYWDSSSCHALEALDDVDLVPAP